MPVSEPINYALVNDDPFMARLLRGLGIDPMLAGDAKIEAPIAGIYTMNINLFITQEAWDADCKEEPKDK